MTVHINLVPESSRKKRTIGVLPIKSLQLPREVVIGLVGGLVAMLVAVHLVLQFFIVLRFVQLHQSTGTLKRISGQKTEVDSVLQHLRKLQNNLKTIDGISKNRKIYWAPKLNALSDVLARGIWLEQISLDKKKLIMKGSAVSKSGAEMIEVNNFVSKLKNDKIFSGDFSRLEQGSIKARKISNTTIADFTITAQLK